MSRIAEHQPQKEQEEYISVDSSIFGGGDDDSSDDEQDEISSPGDSMVGGADDDDIGEERAASDASRRSKTNFLEIHDFSTASDWERLVHEMDGEMKHIRHKIHLFESTNQEQEFFEHRKMMKTRQYERYELSYFHLDDSSEGSHHVDGGNVASESMAVDSGSHVKNKNEDLYGKSGDGNGDDDDSDESEDEGLAVCNHVLLCDSNDYPHRAHHLTRWFQTKRMLVFRGARTEQHIQQQNINLNSASRKSNQMFHKTNMFDRRGVSAMTNNNHFRSERMNEIDRKMTLSALSIAAHRNKLDVPCFVCVDPTLLEYEGIWRNNSSSNIVKFRSEVLKRGQNIPPLYTKVNGLYDLFCLQIGGHVSSLVVSLSARYTYMLAEFDEWKLYNSAERVKMGTVCDPIESLHISCKFRLGNNSTGEDIQMIESLPVRMAQSWECRCKYRKFGTMTIMAQSLKKFVDDAYVPMLKISGSHLTHLDPMTTSEIESRLDAIFDEVMGDEVINEQNKSKIAKSYSHKHLMGQFAKAVLFYINDTGDWQNITHMWRIFISQLRRYWEWSQNATSSDPGSLETFIIPHCNNKIDWSDDLVVQKLDMLNICCLAQVKHNLGLEEREHIDAEEGIAWGEDIISDDLQGSLYEEDIADEMIIHGDKKINIPVTQPTPPKTEDMVTEQQEFITSISDVKKRAEYQCGSVLSDIQAFKYVNRDIEEPVTFRDFLCWYSPNDVLSDGSISQRMEGDNIWKEIWEKAEPVPVKKQKPLFNFKKEAEKICHEFEMMEPSNYLRHITNAIFVWAYDCLADLISEYCGPDETDVPKSIHSALHELKKELKQLLLTPSDSDNLFDVLELLLHKYHEAEWLASVYVSLEFRFVDEPYSTTERSVIEQLMNQGFAVDFSDEKVEILRNLTLQTQDMVKEYIFRTRAPRPYYNSPKSAQLMYVLHKKDEFRISTAMSESLPY